MRTNCAIMSSRVTPLVEEEGTDVDEAIEVGGIAILDCLECSCALLHLIVAVSMAHMTWKWSEAGKGTEKWHRILMIAKVKMSLSRVAVSLYMSTRERMNERKNL